MSSTNRSKAREEHIADYYVTPIPAIKDFLNAFSHDLGGGLTFELNRVLDPCAGGDTNHPMSYPTAIRQWDVGAMPLISTIDIRSDSLAEQKGDYLSMSLEYQPDVIITNPPFNLALPIIRKALVDVKNDGLVIMLLRLNFFGSQERKEFWEFNMPANVYVHSKRMKFLDTHSTDSIEYMHAVWRKGRKYTHTNLRVI